MKKTFLALATLLITGSSHGQGQVDFNNRVLPDVDAPITMPDGTAPGAVPGNPFKAQLLLINGTSTTPVIPTTTFRTSPPAATYYIVDPGVGVNIPGTNPGDTVTLRMIIFNGATFASSTLRGQSQNFQVTLGGGTLPPANLTGLSSFGIPPLPEPSTIALAVLGLGALFALRRSDVTQSKSRRLEDERRQRQT